MDDMHTHADVSADDIISMYAEEEGSRRGSTDTVLFSPRQQTAISLGENNNRTEVTLTTRQQDTIDPQSPNSIGVAEEAVQSTAENNRSGRASSCDTLVPSAHEVIDADSAMIPTSPIIAVADAEKEIDNLPTDDTPAELIVETLGEAYGASIKLTKTEAIPTLQLIAKVIVLPIHKRPHEY